MKLYLSNPGVVCAAGKNPDELWQNLITGDNSAIKKEKTAAGQEFYAAKVPENFLKKSSGRLDSKLIRLEDAALNQLEPVIQKALNQFGAERIAACVGSCDNLTELSNPAHLKFFTENNFGDFTIEQQSAHYVASFIKEKYGLKGPANAFATACSSSAAAIIKAAQLIKAGIADAVIAGGVDIASDTVLLGFNSLEAVSSEPANSFSKNRHGITIGEAAAFFVISKEDLDNQQVVLAGYGESADAYHITSPDPEGAGAAAAMRSAIKNAGIAPQKIDYLNLHGTGTKFNDSMEAKAVDSVFGDYKVPCSTTKGTTGHTLGAGAALELAVCFKALKTGGLPLQHWDGVQDEELPQINIVDKNNPVIQQNTKNHPDNSSVMQPLQKSSASSAIKCCMSNSFAFGGANASIIIKRDDEQTAGKTHSVAEAQSAAKTNGDDTTQSAAQKTNGDVTAASSAPDSNSSTAQLFISKPVCWAPGVETEQDWQSWKSGSLQIQKTTQAPAISFTPMLFRRRLSQLSKMVIQTVHDLIEQTGCGDIKQAFISVYGEIKRQLDINYQTLIDKEILPASFSYSVFNAPSGLASIACKLKSGYSVIFPQTGKFSDGMITACAPVLSGDEESLIVVYGDELIPEEYKGHYDEKIPDGYDTNEPFAFAAVISRRQLPGSKPLNLKDAKLSSPQNFLKELL